MCSVESTINRISLEIENQFSHLQANESESLRMSPETCVFTRSFENFMPANTSETLFKQSYNISNKPGHLNDIKKIKVDSWCHFNQCGLGGFPWGCPSGMSFQLMMLSTCSHHDHCRWGCTGVLG